VGLKGLATLILAVFGFEWDSAVMKAVRVVVLVLLGQMVALSCMAQIKGARDYTRKVVPQEPPPSRAPAQPVPPPPQSAAPAQTADSAKAKAEKDAATKRAVDFQIKRAEAGSATSQYDVAMRYMTGDGVALDYGKARKWLEEAKKNGHQFADKKLTELSKLEKEAANAAKEKPEK
jgi:TPR repeat protein